MGFDPFSVAPFRSIAHADRLQIRRSSQDHAPAGAGVNGGSALRDGRRIEYERAWIGGTSGSQPGEHPVMADDATQLTAYKFFGKCAFCYCKRQTVPFIMPLDQSVRANGLRPVPS